MPPAGGTLPGEAASAFCSQSRGVIRLRLMRRLVASTVLALLPLVAWSEWTRVGDHDKGDIYVDLATIRKQGDMVKMWWLFDHKTAQHLSVGPSFLSSATQDEHDCAEERRRTLSVVVYSEHMGEGTVVFSREDLGGWQAVPPGSAARILLKVACGKE